MKHSRLNRKSVNRGLVALCAVVLFVPLCGCVGYQLGSASLFPQDIQTIHVPIFQSESFRDDLGEQLTEAVVREIQLRSGYKITHSSNADSVLLGRIVEDRKRVLVENTNDDTREIETSFVVQVSWTRRNGLPVASEGTIRLPSSIVAVNGASSFVPETGQSLATAHQKAIRDIARRIVEMMEIPWQTHRTAYSGAGPLESEYEQPALIKLPPVEQ